MGLVGLPDPLSDDLAEAGAGVIQDDSERDSCNEAVTTGLDFR